MHILLIHQAFASLDEAGGTRHFEMAQHLINLGHRFTIITSPISYLTGQPTHPNLRWRDEESPQPGLTIIRSYAFPSLHRSFFHRLINFFSFMVSSFFAGLSVKQVDLVWGTSPPIFQGFTAWLLSRLKHRPFLFEVRDLWPEFAIAIGVLKSPVLIWLSRGLAKFLYRHADQVMVNSPGFLDQVSALGAVAPECVPNGVETDVINPIGDGEAFRSRHHLEQNFVVLYAGAHGISNDLEVVLEASQSLQDQPEIKIVLLGDGKEKANLQQIAKERKLDNVIFLPAIPKKEMASAIAASDACLAILQPLDWYKTTFPNKVFDYMAGGCPVLLAIDGVIREVVEGAGAGLFIPPGNPVALAEGIRQLYHNPALGREMGAKGRQIVMEKFDRTMLSNQLNSLLMSMEEKYARTHSRHR